MKKRRLAIVIVIGLLLISMSGVLAQDDQLQPDADPTYATFTAHEGFAPDPMLFTVAAGGDVNTLDLGEDCSGFVTAAPTAVLNFVDAENIETEVLRFFVYSDYDSSLVVQVPDGSYVCNDDLNPILLDATLDVDHPAPGRYAVWVGTFEPNQKFPAFVALTTRPEVNTAELNLAKLVARGPNPDAINRPKIDISRLSLDAAPDAGTSDFKAGDDDVTKDISAGGDITAFDLDFGSAACTGYIETEPVFSFDFSGDTDKLRIFVSSNRDSTLIVRKPDGEFVCNDDYQGALNLNPLVQVDNPEAGKYIVFVGSFDPAAQIDGTLTVSTGTTEPESLATRSGS